VEDAPQRPVETEGGGRKTVRRITKGTVEAGDKGGISGKKSKAGQTTKPENTVGQHRVDQRKVGRTLPWAGGGTITKGGKGLRF